MFVMVQKIVGLFSLLGLILLLSAKDTFACSCMVPPETEKAFQESSVVFIGRVENVLESPLKKGMKEVRFALMSSFKGTEEVQETRTVVVYTAFTEEACGYSFTPGQEYLVFGTGTPASFQVSFCSRTKILDLARADVNTLLEITKK